MIPNRYSPFIAGLLVFVRSQLGYTCKAFAQLLDKEYNYIWKIEHGEKGISPEFFDYILQKLNLTPATFFAYVPAYIEYAGTHPNQTDFQNSANQQLIH